MNKVIKKIFIFFRPITAVLLVPILFVIFVTLNQMYESHNRRNEKAGETFTESTNFVDEIKKKNITDSEWMEEIRKKYNRLQKFKLIKVWSWCFLYELNIKDNFTYKEWNHITLIKVDWKFDCYKEEDQPCDNYDLCKLCLTEDYLLRKKKTSNCK